MSHTLARAPLPLGQRGRDRVRPADAVHQHRFELAPAAPPAAPRRSLPASVGRVERHAERLEEGDDDVGVRVVAVARRRRCTPSGPRGSPASAASPASEAVTRRTQDVEDAARRDVDPRRPAVHLVAELVEGLLEPEEVEQLARPRSGSTGRYGLPAATSRYESRKRPETHRCQKVEPVVERCRISASTDVPNSRLTRRRGRLPGVVQGADHAGQVEGGRALEPPPAERAARLALEVDDDEVLPGPEHLPEMEVAVTADPEGLDWAGAQPSQPLDDLLLALEHLAARRRWSGPSPRRPAGPGGPGCGRRGRAHCRSCVVSGSGAKSGLSESDGQGHVELGRPAPEEGRPLQVRPDEGMAPARAPTVVARRRRRRDAASDRRRRAAASASSRPCARASTT